VYLCYGSSNFRQVGRISMVSLRPYVQVQFINLWVFTRIRVIRINFSASFVFPPSTETFIPYAKQGWLSAADISAYGHHVTIYLCGFQLIQMCKPYCNSCDGIKDSNQGLMRGLRQRLHLGPVAL